MDTQTKKLSLDEMKTVSGGRSHKEDWPKTKESVSGDDKSSDNILGIVVPHPKP